MSVWQHGESEGNTFWPGTYKLLQVTSYKLHITCIFLVLHTHTHGFILSEDFSKTFCLFPKVVVLPNPKCKTSQRGARGGRREKCTPRLRFGEIYGWTKPKECTGVHSQRLWGRRDLRCAARVIIQSSRSHISLLESRRLWEQTNLSCAQVARAAPALQEQQNKKPTWRVWQQMAFRSEATGSGPTEELCVRVRVCWRL